MNTWSGRFKQLFGITWGIPLIVVYVISDSYLYYAAPARSPSDPLRKTGLWVQRGDSASPPCPRHPSRLKVRFGPSGRVPIRVPLRHNRWSKC